MGPPWPPCFLPGLSLQTKEVLILIGLQDDYFPMDNELHRLWDVVRAFRKCGYVIWIPFESTTDRIATRKQEDGNAITVGHAIPRWHALAAKEDLCIIMKTRSSAFGSATLLESLRKRMIFQLYLCGHHKDPSIFATAIDAAQHGISITILKDFLGNEVQTEHTDKEHPQELVESIGAKILTRSDILGTRTSTYLMDEDWRSYY